MAEIKLHGGYRPGAIGRVVELHGAYYAENWGFGPYFEAKVARELAEFMDRYDERRDGFWTAVSNGRVAGAVAIDGSLAHTQGAHLRWFIVSGACRGTGLGGALLNRALNFCRDCGYGRVYLWTFAGLEAAAHLYRKAGFTLVTSQRGRQWGTEVVEQRHELTLP